MRKADQVQNDAPMINVFEQIEDVCRKFRRRLKKGESVAIEDYLTDFDETAQATIFRNLLQIEIEFRRHKGETPNSNEYIKRFPSFARIVRQAFFQSTMMSMASMHDTSEHSNTGSFDSLEYDNRHESQFDVPAASHLGDYTLVRELGRGGFGVVYEARHIQRGNRVALKTLPTGGQRAHALDDAERLHKFRREFRTLAEINHPNLIGMQTLEVDGSQWFFTMDLVDGEDFISYVRPRDVLNESRLRAALPQLVNGILGLHGYRVIHRDLKPSNVLVAADGTVTILDFGLVVELEQRSDQTASLQSKHFAGTPLYAAPEQMAGERTAASDWYALGVLLYESLTGERPFSGSFVELIKLKQESGAPKLAGRDGLPDDLAKLTDDLLSRDADDRPDPLEIARILSVDIGDGSESTSIDSVDSRIGFEASPGESILIGREQQLELLKQAKQELIDKNEAMALFVSGRSGEGKTSLVEKFLAPVRNDTDMLVLSGRCYDRESVPFKAIDCVIDALVAFLRGKKDPVVEKLLPDDTRFLAHLFPVLKRVPAVGKMAHSPVANLDSKQIRDRGFRAFRKLLERIGRTTPVIMFIDDLQWGDQESSAIVFEMLTSANAPKLMLIGTYRRDEAEDSPFLNEWDKLQSASETEITRPRISVGPLSEDQCISLVVNRTGIENNSIRQRAIELYQSTGGNPYFLDQLIDCFDPETGSFTPAPLEDVIDGKLNRLPAGAAELLRVIAVSGHSIAISEAAATIGMESGAYSTLTHMRSERLVRWIGSDDQESVDTYHDKIRETVLDGFDNEERKQLHLDLARTIESLEKTDPGKLLASLTTGATDDLPIPERIFDLAYHCEMGGDRGRAAVYQILAAEKAKSQFALSIAADNYRLAKANSTELPQQIQFRALFGLGATLVQAGNYEDAEQELDAALPLAQEGRQKLMVKLTKADMIFKSRSVVESVVAFEDVLRSLGVWVPRSQTTAYLGCLKESLMATTRTYLPFLFRKKTADWKANLIVRVLNLSIYAYVCRSRSHAVWSNLAASNRVQSLGKGPNRVIYLTNAGMIKSCVAGRRGDSIQDFEEAYELATELDDVNLQAFVLFFRGWSQLALGKIKESIKTMQESFEMYSKTGDAYRLTYLQMKLNFAYSILADFKKATPIARAAFEKTIQLGQTRQTTMLLGSWSQSVRGQLPFDQLDECFDCTEDDLIIYKAYLHGKSTWLLRQGRIDEAIECVEKALDYRDKYGVQFYLSIYFLPVLVRALRARADSIESESPAESMKLRRRALKQAKTAVRLARRFVILQPFAWRELALAHASLGRTRKALTFAQRSLETADQQEAKYESAESMLVCGQLSKQLGLPNADQMIEQAESKLNEFDDQIRQANQEVFGLAPSREP